jgi:hypothetical protein
MKKLTCKLLGIAFIGAAQFAVPTAGAQTTIYQDSLIGTGNTLGTVQVSSGTLGGSAGATWGGGGWTATASGAQTSSTPPMQYLAFTPQSGEIYTLSANIGSVDPTNVYPWIDLGFLTSTTLNSWGSFMNYNTSGPGLQLRQYGPLDLFSSAGNQTGGGSINNLLAEVGGTQGGLYSITLDTTNGSDWKYSFSGPGITTTTYDLGAPTNIVAVGFDAGSYGGGFTATVSNFALTASVPEPSTWAMLLGGLGMLTMFRRRRA